MKAYQIHDLIVRLSIATGVVLAMMATVHGLTSVSQHHVARDLTKYAAKDGKATLLTNVTPAHKA